MPSRLQFLQPSEELYCRWELPDYSHSLALKKKKYDERKKSDALPAFPKEILKITISHKFHQNKNRLGLGHHSDQLHYMFRSEEKK